MLYSLVWTYLDLCASVNCDMYRGVATIMISIVMAISLFGGFLCLSMSASGMHMVDATAILMNDVKQCPMSLAEHMSNWQIAMRASVVTFFDSSVRLVLLPLFVSALVVVLHRYHEIFLSRAQSDHDFNHTFLDSLFSSGILNPKFYVASV